MASSSVYNPCNANPTKPAAIVKAMPRCAPASSTGRPSVLSGVGNLDPTRRTRREGDGNQGGRPSRGMVTRNVASTRSALSGVENLDTTTRAKRDGPDQCSKQAKGKGLVATKTKATTTRVPKTTKPLNKPPPLGTKTEGGATTTRASNAAAAHKVPGARRTCSQTTSAQDPEVPAGQQQAIVLTDRRYVTTRSKSTRSTATGQETRRPTAHVPLKAKKTTKTTVRPPLAEKPNTADNQIAPQGKNEPPAEKKTDSQSIGRELVPYEPEADIDLTTDPSMCGEYAGDIYTYHRQLEEDGHYLVCATFLNHQKDINSGHRCVLVDWLAQVHYKYHLLQETMLLTVDILDRYLQVYICG